MQSQLDLRDLLPGFALHPLCRAGKARRRADSGAIRPMSNAERCFRNQKSEVNMTTRKVLLTSRVRQHRGPARMHRLTNAAGIYSTDC